MVLQPALAHLLPHNMTAQQPRPKLITLITLSGLAVLSMNMFAPAMAAMALDFQVPYATVTLAVSAYLALTAALQLLVGPLSDRYGRRPVLLTSLLLFVLASVAAATAGDVWVFLVARVAQGAIVAGNVLPRAIIRDTTSVQEGASMQGYVSMAMAIAPILGPSIGGGLAQWAGWRANFWLYAVLGAVLLLWCWRDLHETHHQRSTSMRAQWHMYRQLLKAPRFWGFALCIAFSVNAFYVFVSGMPWVAGQILHLPQAQVGMLMGTISMGFFVGSFIAGWRSKHHALTTMMIAGRSVALAGLAVGCALSWLGWVNPWVIFGSTVFAGLGNGISFPSSQTGTMTVEPKLAGSAAGLSGALSMATGAVLTTITGAVVQGPWAAQLLLSLMTGILLVAWLMALWSCAMARRQEAPPPQRQP